MNIDNLSDVLSSQPAYRYRQINKFLFADYISSWEEASSLPKSLREELSERCPLAIKAEIVEEGGSKGSRKALISLEDGEAIETVLIKQRADKHDDGNHYRYTACVSSQVGCPLACVFCATGQEGFRRNLKASEIINQVVFWQRLLKQEKGGAKIDNIVFMGMGEPFLNYSEFIKAAKFFNNPETMNIGARRLSVSTAGVVAGIKKLASEKMQINLALSLHTANEDLRHRLMPMMKHQSLSALLKATDQYIAKTGRRVMIEYLMLKGVNNSVSDAEALAKMFVNRPLYLINLIPYNDTGRFQACSKEETYSFRQLLEKRGLAVTVRLSFGADITAACGQLKPKREKK